MMKLAVEISDASDLAPKDGAASCNPYVEVEFDDQRQRTATKPADRSPQWNQTLLFHVRDPARFDSLHIDVSVLHDRRLHDHNATRPHTFLGRVRINAASVAAATPQEAVLQRYPLEKRGLFSRVSGDIALRIYTLHQDAPPPDHAGAGAGATTTDHAAAPRHHHQQQQDGGDRDPAPHLPQDQPEIKHEQQPPRPRIFRSVPPPAAAPPPPPASASEPRRATLHAVAAPPPPPGQTVVMPRPAATPAPAGPSFGLVETKPPLPAKMGPRAAAAAAKIASTYDMVEPMMYLYVSVVKARDLPNMDVTGALDPFVEVKLGNFKGVTRHLEKNPNPVWRQT